MTLIGLSMALGLVVSLLGTPALIRWLQERRYSQAIRQSTDTVKYPEHQAKAGTPSMGGLAIILAILVAYLGTHLAFWIPPSASGLLALYLVVGLGLVGVADDYLKIFKRRATGLRARTKLIGQAFIALTFGLLSLQFPDDRGLTPASAAVSFLTDTSLVLPTVLFLLWIWFLVTATTNGVNLTDGLDGLVSGAAMSTFIGYLLISLWQLQNTCADLAGPCFDVRDPLDLAIFAGACLGAVVGFLWWNTSPARIFMGDTGSLAIGGAIAALAIMSRTQLLLILLGGLFLVISVSVILQVGSFKLTRRRIFRMAPLHHHFELLGWPEVQIVVRFWIVQAIFVGAALALFHAEWVRT